MLKNRKIIRYVGSDTHLPLEGGMIKDGRAEFIKQESETEVPIPNSSSDVILMFDMFHHVNIKAQPRLLKSVKNKLKHNGMIIVFEYTFSETKRPVLDNEASCQSTELTLFQKLEYLTLMDWVSNVVILKRNIPMLYSFRTYEEWEKLFMKLGYKIAYSKYIGFPKEFFHQGPFCLFILKK